MLQMVAVAHPVVAEDDAIAAAHRGEALGEDTWSHHVCEAPVNVTGAAKNLAAGRVEREWPGALLARRAPTMEQWSLDARSKGQSWPLP